MKKKRKFATTLLATALLSYGFTINTTEEITQPEPEPATEVTVTQVRKPVIKSQDVVERKISDTRKETEQPITDTATPTENQATDEESPPRLAPEPTDKPTFESPEATNQTPQPPDTSQAVTNVTPPQPEEAQPKPQENPPQSETSPEIPNQPPISQTDDVLHEILSETYDFKGDEVIYTENSIIHITYPPENQEPVYVDGFGWVEPSNEPSVRIEALDMVENGNKVGTMGG